MKENVLTEILVLSNWKGNKFTNYFPPYPLTSTIGFSRAHSSPSTQCNFEKCNLR